MANSRYLLANLIAVFLTLIADAVRCHLINFGGQ